MPILSADQLAYIRSVKSDNYSDTAQIERDDALITAAQSCRRWPASQAPRMLRLFPELGQDRIDTIAMFPDSANLKIGDTLTIGTVVAHIIGLGHWQTTIAVALAEEPQ